MNNILIRPKHYGAGFFSYVWCTLRVMYSHPWSHYHIHYGPEFSYYDSTIGDNAWEYYFLQPNKSFVNDLDTIELSGDDSMGSEYRDGFMDDQSISHIQDIRDSYNKIIKENVVIQPHIQEKIDLFIKDNFTNNNILGIHLRGTDHPCKKPMSDYFDIIDSYEKDYDIIFASSDEQERIDVLIERYGNKVITYNSIRSKSDTQLHHGWDNISIRYNIGEDVLIESCLLSNTHFLLCCSGSNVNYFSRALNPKLKYLEVI